VTITDPNPLASDIAYSLASLSGARTRIAAALALPCDEHDATVGKHCWGSPLSSVRGVCRARFEAGLRSPARQPKFGERLAATPSPSTRLEFRHPNRHPMTPIRTAVAR